MILKAARRKRVQLIRIATALAVIDAESKIVACNV